MKDFSDIERLISIRIIKEDAETIFSLISSERNSILQMGIIPYYALFVQSCQEYLGEKFLPEEIVLHIKDIRNYIKAYADSFGKSRQKILSSDFEQDASFKSQLRFDFLKSWNIHLNLGTYQTDAHHIVGNTQQLAAYFEAEDLSDPKIEKRLHDLGYQIASFVCSVRRGLSEYYEQPTVLRDATAITIQNYYDLNTNRRNTLFVNNSSKELNLFYLHLLCSMNFVKYVLRPLFFGENTWTFRVEYIVTYYTFRALQRMKNYCENNDDIVADVNALREIEAAGDGIFETKLRNCMMHYSLVNQKVLSPEYIDRPFYGIIENCFEGTEYQTYSESLHCISDRIISFLEMHFNCAKVKLKQL